MFSNLSEKTKAALFLALGMGLFLLAGSLVHFFPKFNLIENVPIEKNSSQSSSIDELYSNLSNTDTDKRTLKSEEIYRSEIQSVQTEVDDRWVLYVTGSVKNPGIYKLQAEARVFQLVEAAGGFTAMADTIAVNMAARLQDGDHLHVPKINENSSTINGRSQTITGANSVAANNSQNKQNNGAATRNQRSKKNPQSKSINLNTATAAELQTLPGIGPALSERIIQYRNKNGRFKVVSDLIHVQGIGAKVLDSIEPFVFVR
ncbi:MAG: helix-hairpin-helix domain-containing protein [Synergistaceae bacterium]|nr:helix-hairpin-helix domain-containing protein [Synergistaceae bacterium]